ncbi:MAG: hypothetical protein HYX68_24920 [Planctomycetes bacterium]|nr:hypothetical protein [Planctomycetota bacterium]
MSRYVLTLSAALIGASSLWAQPPSYSKHIRPFFVKYCLECHAGKDAKAGLSLETYKAVMAGADGGAVIVPGKPDDSRLVLLCEGKDKPKMPPRKAKFQPKADEIKLLRAWVAAGARDDGASVKVVLPVIKAKADVLAPVRVMAYRAEGFFARGGEPFRLPGGASMKIEFKTDIRAMAISPIDDYIALGFGGTGEPGTAILFWTGRLRAHVEQLPTRHTDAILDVAFDPRGKLVATCGYDSLIQITDVSKLTRGKVARPRREDDAATALFTLKEHSDAVYGLAFNPDGTLLASVSADRAMKVFDVEKGKLLYTLGEATDWLYTVAWSPDGRYLVSGGVDKSIRVYELNPLAKGERLNIKLRQSVFAHEGPVQKVLFSRDSRTLYSVGQDRVIKAWDVEKMVERKVYAKQPETVLCMALREDAGQIIIGRYDGIVQLIDIKTGMVVHEFGKEKKKAKVNQPGAQATGFRGAAPSLALRAGGSPASAAKITTPTTRAGTLDRAGAVHYYRFDVKKGQPLGIHLELKSKIDPVLTLTDLAGRTLAESHDGLLGHTFAEAGSYAIGVRDREYRGGADFKYRLKLGEIPIVTAVFPLGVQGGTKGEIGLEGVFLPRKALRIVAPPDGRPGQAIPLSLGNGVLGKAQVVVGEWPEVLGGGKVPVPGTANGQLVVDKQNDVWAFPAQKGRRLVIEVDARRIGSKLDSIIEILDKNDQLVPRAVLRSQAKTHVTFRDHDSAQGNIRIEAWSELTINDYLFAGNELMKIQALPTHPDADCNFFATQGQRIGYLDTTPTHHANGTPMYKVSVHPPSATFPPNGYPVFTLYYRNDDGGPGFGRDSRILFDPPADGEYKVRIRDARDRGGVNFGYRLTVRPPKEQFKLRVSPARTSVCRGGAIPLTFTAERIDGYEGPIRISMSNLPAGFHVPATMIEAGRFSTTVALYAAVDAKPSPPGTKAILQGEGLVKGLPFGSAEAVELPNLIDPGDIVTTTQVSEVAIKPGGQAKLLVRIERKNGFTGRVPLEVRGLPHGVKVLDIGLNGILVNPNETTRTVVIYAEPWVRAQDHPFVVLAKREGKNSEHAAKSVVLRVK